MNVCVAMERGRTKIWHSRSRVCAGRLAAGLRPPVLVDHYTARRDEPRHYVSVGKIGNATEFANHAFNIVVAVWEDLSPSRRLAFLIWHLLIGTRTCPGLAQALRFTPKLGLGSWERFVVAQRGLFDAYRMLGLRRGAARRAAWSRPPWPPETLADEDRHRHPPPEPQGRSGAGKPGNCLGSSSTRP